MLEITIIVYRIFKKWFIYSCVFFNALVRFIKLSLYNSSTPSITLKIDQNCFVKPIVFNNDIRKGVQSTYPSIICFNFNNEYKTKKIQFSIALKKVGFSFSLNNLFMHLKVEVVTNDKTISVYNYDLPVEGPFKNNLDNQICAYLTEFWADNIIDLKSALNISKVNFHITLLSNDDKKLNGLSGWAINPCVTVPNLINQLNYPTIRKNIIILSIESWTDPNFVLDPLENALFNKKYDDILKLFNTFSGGIAQSDWTFPTTASMFFGLYPSQHGFTHPRILKQKTKWRYFGPTLGNIAKSSGFMTFARVFSRKYGPNLGYLNGFDSYEWCPQALGLINPRTPNIQSVINALEKYSTENCFIFLHTDLLHAPQYAIAENWGRNISAKFPEIEKNQLKFPEYNYFLNLRMIYLQLSQIVEYLKMSNNLDNTMIILLGDHGTDAVDNWAKYKSIYPLRESRIRIPYAIHWPIWSKYYKNNGKYIKGFREGNIDLIKDLCKVLNKDIPDPLGELAQYDSKFNPYCISESIHHPNNEDYFLSIRNDKEKYIMKALVDWNKLQILNIQKEYLFPVNEEQLDLSKEQLYSNLKSTNYHDLAINFLEKNLQLRKEVLPEFLKSF